MSLTMQEFERDYIAKRLPKLSPEDRRKAVESLPLEERLAGLSEEEIREYLRKHASKKTDTPPKSKRKE